MSWDRRMRLLLAAAEALRDHRLRSFLASLGLLVGVAAVVVMVGVGEGTRNQVLERLTALGTNVITVRSAKRAFSGLRSRTTSEVQSLEPADADALGRLEGAEGAAPLEMRLMRITGPAGTTDSVVLASTPDIFVLEGQALAEGRFFNEREEKGRRRVAVVGRTLREHLAGEKSLVGRTVDIRKQPFLIVGELQPKGLDANGNDLDDRLYLPLRTAQSRLLGGQRYVGLIVVRAKNEGAAGALTEQVAQLLRQRHRLRPGQEDDFRIQTQEETIKTREESSRLFTATITGVAAVSLLVAGVGIMAVMLIAVKERTPEIGLRRAVGARRRDVLLQFLTEASALGLLGGGGGAVLGLLVAALVRELSALEFDLPWPQALGATALSIAIALAFGLAPARKAANLMPVEALRES
ncbi:MAG: ABC transporter permease [Thermodesulfobacteriota bacterium]